MIVAAGLTQTEAAATIETVQSRIAGLVNGQGNITVGDLERMATMLGFTDPGYQAALLERRRDNHKRGFWTSGHNRAYGEEIRLLIDIERHAERIRGSMMEIVPGLLQCESYVRALCRCNRPRRRQPRRTRAGAGSALGHLRQGRSAQRALCVVRVVLAQGVGDAKVMREQIDYLIKLSNWQNMMIQIMWFNAPLGRRSSIGESFILMRIPSPGVAGSLDMAYIEGVAEIRYLDDKKVLDAHDNAWPRLSTAALNFEESRLRFAIQRRSSAVRMITGSSAKLVRESLADEDQTGV